MSTHTNPQPAPASQPDFLFLADHPVLDLLNTVARPAAEVVDLWQSDADVLRWLSLTGLLPSVAPQPGEPGALLLIARALREEVRALIVDRKAGRPLHPGVLNRLLAAGRSFCELTQSADGTLAVLRRYAAETPEQILTPLAEAAAEFLATADLHLVRPCEGEGCVLWFYDRTRSHRRRWCSMEVCGNRHKVAAFRSRQKEQ